MSKKNPLAWHFINERKELANGDRRKVCVGQTLKVAGEPLVCHRGLHASFKVMDAFLHADCLPILCRVQLGGQISRHVTTAGETDKVAAQERTVLWMVDSRRAMRLLSFAWVVECLENPEHHKDWLMRTPKHRAKVARLAKRLMDHYFDHDNRLTGGVFAYDDKLRTRAELTSGPHQACLATSPWGAMNSVIGYTNERKPWMSRTFRKFIGMERRGTLSDEVSRIRSRLSTIERSAYR